MFSSKNNYINSENASVIKLCSEMPFHFISYRDINGLIIPDKLPSVYDVSVLINIAETSNDINDLENLISNFCLIPENNKKLFCLDENKNRLILDNDTKIYRSILRNLSQNKNIEIADAENLIRNHFELFLKTCPQNLIFCKKTPMELLEEIAYGEYRDAKIRNNDIVFYETEFRTDENGKIDYRMCYKETSEPAKNRDTIQKDCDILLSYMMGFGKDNDEKEVSNKDIITFIKEIKETGFAKIEPEKLFFIQNNIEAIINSFKKSKLTTFSKIELSEIEKSVKEINCGKFKIKEKTKENENIEM